MNRVNHPLIQKPTQAYIIATWSALGVGVVSYLIGLWNATIQLNEKGFYFAVFLLALFSATTLQKVIRDQAEGNPSTGIYCGLCWGSFGTSVMLLLIGLYRVELVLGEKGFYLIAFVLSLFSVITLQKNVRDAAAIEAIESAGSLAKHTAISSEAKL